jgi:uncharacterized membrane protein
MGRHFSRWVASAALAIALAIAPASAAGSVQYDFQDLGFEDAIALNNAGQVIGEARYSPAWYFDGTRRIDVPIGEETDTTLRGINNSGVAVGSFFTPIGRRPLRFDGTTASEIPFQGAQPKDNITALDINDAGDVLIDIQSYADETHHPVLLTAGGQQITIPLLPGLTSMLAYAVNNNRVVVGGPGDPVGEPAPAFRFQDGQTSQLAPLPAGVTQATALDINDAGVAVGYGTADSAARVALIFHDGQVTNLSETLNRDIDLAAINSRGEMVGAEGGDAALFDGLVETDLETLVNQPDWKLFRATDVNDRGQIVGSAISRDAPPDDDIGFKGFTGFLLTRRQGPAAIPLPAAAGPGLALLGLVGGVTATRRAIR